MDCRTGEIKYFANPEEIEAFNKKDSGSRLLQLTNEQERQLRPMSEDKRKNSMRNKKCPCGSKRKFKKCCWYKYA